MPPVRQITAATVRDDFNDPLAVIHYTRAAHFLGLWKSERCLIERFFTDKTAALIEAGCGSGRVTLGLWDQGYHNLTAFDFAEELVAQARDLAQQRGAPAITILHADATRLTRKSNPSGYDPSTNSQEAPQTVCHLLNDKLPKSESGEANRACHLIDDKGNSPAESSIRLFDGALFMFNGLMQIPGRENRRTALRELHAVCRPGAPLLFTTHDRDSSPTERALWRLEALRWDAGTQDQRLLEFGDRYFEDETGRTFMHLPDRAEILDDLAATGWQHHFDAMRREIAHESRAVLDFSDECRFWVAHRKD